MGDVRILIVDDVEENLTALGAILSSFDAMIVKAQSGNEALSLLLENDFALVILDVQMPDMDGFETAELMRGMNKTKFVPIIFATAINKEKEYIFKGYEIGAVDYLFKPIEPAILKSKVRVFLELYSQKLIIEEQANELQSKVDELNSLTSLLEKANHKLQNRTDELTILAAKDGLTGIANRRTFQEFLHREWRNCRRDKLPITLMIIDIDFFKAFNDRYGHIQGDECLREVAKLLKKAAQRGTDLAARYGGEEFALVLSRTKAEDGEKIAHRFTNLVESAKIAHESSKVNNFLTVSVGLATVIPEHSDFEALIQMADKALYNAKNSGRNKIMVYKE